MLSAILSCVVLTFPVFPVAAVTTRGTTQPTDIKILHQVDLGEGRSLVITQSPPVPAGALKGWASDAITDRPVNPLRGLFSMDVQLRLASGLSLMLWCEHFALYTDSRSEYDDYRVLDLAIFPDRVLFVIAGPLGHLSAHEIMIGGGSRSTRLRPPMDWELAVEAASRAPDAWRAKISFDQSKGQTAIEVIESREDVVIHTRFEQQNEAFQFVPTKQWRESDGKAE